MSKYIHICLVSAQPSPTLAPLLSDSYPAERVVLVVSPEQEKQAALPALEAVLGSLHIPCERLPVASAWDADTVTEAIENFLEQLPDESQPLVNATGGTKPMSTGAFMACFNKNVPVYYINVDKLNWLYIPKEQKAQYHDTPLGSRLKIKPLVEAHGVTVLSAETESAPRDCLDLAREWLRRSKSQGAALGALNELASQAEGSLVVTMRDNYSNRFLEALLYELQQAELVTLQGKTVRFRDEWARAFANGHWLEYIVYHELLGIQQRKPELGIQEVVRSLRVNIQSIKGARAEQEIDVAVLAGNRLYLIECKTGKLSRQDSIGDSKAEDALFKLAAIKDRVGGSNTRGMLISYRSIRAVDKERAPILGLRVAETREVDALRGELCKWLKSEQG